MWAMFSIFIQYHSKGPIKLDMLVKYVYAIEASLVHLKTIEEIIGCMIKPE